MINKFMQKYFSTAKDDDVQGLSFSYRTLNKCDRGKKNQFCLMRQISIRVIKVDKRYRDLSVYIYYVLFLSFVL